MEVLHNGYFSHNVGVNKSKSMSWEVHVACMTEMKGGHNIVAEKPQRKTLLQGHWITKGVRLGASQNFCRTAEKHSFSLCNAKTPGIVGRPTDQKITTDAGNDPRCYAMSPKLPENVQIHTSKFVLINGENLKL